MHRLHEPTSATPPRTKLSLRGRRIRPAELGLDQMTIRGVHHDANDLHGEVHDFSAHGVCFVLAQRPSAVLVGDKVSDLTLHANGNTLYRGAGVVRRLDPQSESVMLGLELNPALDLGAVYRTGVRASVADRWQAARQRARHSEVSLEFRQWVATVRHYLECLEGFLQAEEKELHWEDLEARNVALGQLLEVVTPGVMEDLAEARAQLNALVEVLPEDEHAAHRAYCQRELSPFFDQSPFVKRGRAKPLGYAGDYELMNMLYRDCDVGTTLLGRLITLYSKSEEASVANVRRIAYLKAKITGEIDQVGQRRLRATSVGCGPAQEIKELLTERPEVGGLLDVALIDQESKAISYCERQLAGLIAATDARVHFVQESARRLLTGRRSSALADMDLIYSAGMFDYLGDKSFTAMLSTLYAGLAPGGLLIVGNVAKGNPSRWLQEYIGEWFLNYRDRKDLLAFGDALSPRPTSIAVESEDTGWNIFLVVRR